jgi:hypothetical protein
MTVTTTKLTVHMKAAKMQYHGHGLLRLQSFRITLYFTKMTHDRNKKQVNINDKNIFNTMS